MHEALHTLATSLRQRRTRDGHHVAVGPHQLAEDFSLYPRNTGQLVGFSVEETAKVLEVSAQSLVTEESAVLAGQKLGHYQIVGEIGRGGMGVVYLAQDDSLGRPVALKLLAEAFNQFEPMLRIRTT